MFYDDDYTVWRLQRAKNVWRAIAIALAAALVLLMVVGAVGGLLLAKRGQHALRAERAMREAVQQRNLAERARIEAQRAAEMQKAKLP